MEGTNRYTICLFFPNKQLRMSEYMIDKNKSDIYKEQYMIHQYISHNEL